VETSVAAVLSVLSIPLIDPFRTADGVIDRRVVVLVAVGTDVIGWGEAAPYPGQDESVEALLEAASAGMMTPTLAAAVDQALADRRARTGLRSLGAPGASTVPVCVAVGIDDAANRVDELARRGVTRFKVKIAPGATDHLADIRREHPDIAIGVDGNRSFPSLDGTVGVLSDVGVEFAEELLTQDAPGTSEPLTDVGIPHFADESIRTVDDARRILASGRFTGVTVKPGRLGWTGACAVRDMARAAGRPWRASGLLETGLGRAYTDRLAAEQDAFTSDVAPADWFLASAIAPRTVVDGRVVVPAGPGVGVEPDPDAMDRFLLDRRVVEVDLPEG
jgi:O-succinylbenzoate synthase